MVIFTANKAIKRTKKDDLIIHLTFHIQYMNQYAIDLIKKAEFFHNVTHFTSVNIQLPMILL